MTISPFQLSFQGGEWSPSLYGRTDIEGYNYACRQVKNMFVTKYGGASNRPGLEFIDFCKYDDKVTRIIPFEFSVVQAYILEFGDQYIRILKDGALVDEPIGSGTDIRTAAFKWTASASGTDEYYIELAAGGDPSLDKPLNVVEDAGSGNTLLTYETLGSFALGSWGYGDNDSLGYETIYVRLSDGADPDSKALGYLEASYPYEVVTPFVEADISLLKFSQSDDTLIITHPSYAPRSLTRTGHDVWSLSTITFASSIAAPTITGGSGASKYVITAVNLFNEESRPSNAVDGAVGVAITITGTVAAAAYYKVYKDLNSSGVYGYIGIVSISASPLAFTEATSLDPDYNQTPPTNYNPFNGTDNYPGSSTFFESRLVFSRTNNNPQTVWGSVVNTLYNMNITTPLTESASYQYTINSNQVNEVRWLMPQQVLLLGTSGAEWQMRAGAQSNTISPLAVDNKRQSNWGVSDVAPVSIGGTVIFLENSSEVVRTLSYSDENRRYVGKDLSYFAEHLFEGKPITAMSYQQAPQSIIWCVRSDGALIGLTIQEDYGVTAWHNHETEGLFKSVATIQNESKDDTYFVVERTLNGVVKQGIEKLSNRLEPRDDGFVDIQDAFFVDAGKTFDSPVTITGISQADPGVVTATAHGFEDGDYVDIVEVAGMTEVNDLRFIVANKTANTFELTTQQGVDVDTSAYGIYLSGGKVRKAKTIFTTLEHLEGEEVTILADGGVVTKQTVTDGKIELLNRASRVHVGLGYESVLETIDIDFVVNGSSSTDKLKVIPSIVMKLRNTRSLYVGTTEANVNEVPFRSNENYGTPTRLFNGDAEAFLESTDMEDSRVVFKNVDPLPLTVLSYTARIQSGT